MKRSAKNYCAGIKNKPCGRQVTRYCKRCDKYADTAGKLELRHGWCESCYICSSTCVLEHSAVPSHLPLTSMASAEDINSNTDSKSQLTRNEDKNINEMSSEHLRDTLSDSTEQTEGVKACEPKSLVANKELKNSSVLPIDTAESAQTKLNGSIFTDKIFNESNDSVTASNTFLESSIPPASSALLPDTAANILNHLLEPAQIKTCESKATANKTATNSLDSSSSDMNDKFDATNDACNDESHDPATVSNSKQNVTVFSVNLSKNGDDIMEQDNHHHVCCDHNYDDSEYPILLDDNIEVDEEAYKGEDDTNVAIDLNIDCTDHDDTISSVLAEDYEEGYNVMVVRCDGKDTVFQSGVKVTSKKGETRVFVHALKPRAKYGENIIPVYTAENDFENWLSQKASKSQYSWQTLQMAPNPIIFWRLVTDSASIESMSHTYCGDVATDLRKSIASYLKQSHHDNCGDIDDMIEDAAKLSAVTVTEEAKSSTKGTKKQPKVPVELNLSDKRPRGVGKPKKYGFDDVDEGITLTKKQKKGAANLNRNTAILPEAPILTKTILPKLGRPPKHQNGATKKGKEKKKTKKDSNNLGVQLLNAPVVGPIAQANSDEPPTWVAQLLKGLLATPSAKATTEKNKTSSNNEKKKKKQKKRDIFAQVEKSLKKSHKINLMGVDFSSELQLRQQSNRNKFQLSDAAHNSQMRAFERNELLLDTHARAQANALYTSKPPQTSFVQDMIAISSTSKTKSKKKNAIGESSSKSTSSNVNMMAISSSIPVDSESEESASERDSDDVGDNTGSEDTDDDDEEEDDSSSDEDDTDEE